MKFYSHYTHGGKIQTMEEEEKENHAFSTNHITINYFPFTTYMLSIV